MSRIPKSGLRYIGPGFVPGIPARDLSPEELERYGGKRMLLNIRSPHTGRGIYIDQSDENIMMEENSDGRADSA